MAGNVGLTTSGPGYRIVRVAGRLRALAAKRLLGPGRSDAASVARFLDAAKSHGIDLTHLWATVDLGGDKVRQVCLIVMGAGRAAMTFTSEPADAEEQAELAALTRFAVAQVPGIHLTQALLECHEKATREALIGAGYRDVGTLAYLRRPMAALPPIPKSSDGWPPNALLRRYQSGDDPALVEGLDRSYTDTLDCPELCGLRATADVLESHRAAGHWDPAHWWIIDIDRKIEGMLLLNPSPELGSVELVYIGLAPSLRGAGLGRRLLNHGLAHLRGRGEEFITCAVDARNTPALRLYHSLEFTEFARRVALVCPVNHAVENRR